MIHEFEVTWETLPNPAHPVYKGKFQINHLEDDIFEVTQRARRELARSGMPQDLQIFVKYIGVRTQ